MTTATAKSYEIKKCSTGFQIVDSEDDLVVFQSCKPREVVVELQRLGGSAAAATFLWELETAKRYGGAPGTAGDAPYVRVHITLEACDKNIERVRALYREIKGRELDESRTREQGYYRYPSGARNTDPEFEKRFGHRIEYRARYYTVDGRIVPCDDMVCVLNLFRAGYDLGYNLLGRPVDAPGGSLGQENHKQRA